MMSQAPTETAVELHLCLLDSAVERPAPKRIATVAAGSVLVNLLVLLLVVQLAEFIPAPASEQPEVVDVRKAIPLIAPRLTQKAPNRAEVAKDLTLENLTARPQTRPAPKSFVRPPSAPAGRPAATAPPVLEPSHVQIAQAPPPMAGTTPNLPGPPVPQTPKPAEEKPKLAFETPGSQTVRPPGTGSIQVPNANIQEAIQRAAKPGSGGIQVGDAGADADAGAADSPMQPGSRGRQASSLELLSDPMGIDFKPYLIRVLAAVRKNWFAVIPESARLGRRGKVVIQFAISREGAVPKLVIAVPSGTEALDRAAVAGISASNPFPPLPPNFRGEQIRLQLAFSYNVPSR